MLRTHLNIGSNLGDRRENIMQAVAHLRRLAYSHTPEPDFRVSDIVESEPWGFESENTFYNIGVSFLTPLEPMDLLLATQQIERTIADAPHRNADGSYADRPIDIDIIFLGDLHIQIEATPDTPALTLPHPRRLQRRFVIEPLRQIDPEMME